jgi:hypothetical protein
MAVIAMQETAAAPSKMIFCSYDPAIPVYWRLEQPYERATSSGPIIVPIGFVWDGASVPRHFWSILPPWGPYSGAALIHDYLCDVRPPGISSDQAHRIFYDLMIEDGVVKNDAWVMYKAVQRFGPQWA